MKATDMVIMFVTGFITVTPRAVERLAVDNDVRVAMTLCAADRDVRITEVSTLKLPAS